NGGRTGIERKVSRQHWVNMPEPSGRRSTRCKSAGGMRESGRKISRSSARSARQCAIAIAGHRPGGRLVFGVDSRGADGTRVRLGPQPHHGGGNVAEVWVVSR